MRSQQLGSSQSMTNSHEAVRCSRHCLKQSLAASQVVGAHLEGGMGTVTSAVKCCLQFYVDANAITAQTEASLRDLITTLEASQ